MTATYELFTMFAAVLLGVFARVTLVALVCAAVAAPMAGAVALKRLAEARHAPAR